MCPSGGCMPRTPLAMRLDRSRRDECSLLSLQPPLTCWMWLTIDQSHSVCCVQYKYKNSSSFR
jgi:hypothetical protein